MTSPLNLSASTSQRASSGATLGNTRGGGAQFHFGGINDSPGGNWLWIGLAVAGLAVAGYLLWKRK